MHYVVWMRLIPEDDSAEPRAPIVRAELPRAYADVGALVLWLALLGMIAFAVWAAFHVGHARNGYIQAAFFHGHLELVAGALLWAEAGDRAASIG